MEVTKESEMEISSPGDIYCCVKVHRRWRFEGSALGSMSSKGSISTRNMFHWHEERKVEVEMCLTKNSNWKERFLLSDFSKGSLSRSLFIKYQSSLLKAVWRGNIDYCNRWPRNINTEGTVTRFYESVTNPPDCLLKPGLRVKTMIDFSETVLLLGLVMMRMAGNWFPSSRVELLSGKKEEGNQLPSSS